MSSGSDITLNLKQFLSLDHLHSEKSSLVTPSLTNETKGEIIQSEKVFMFIR